MKFNRRDIIVASLLAAFPLVVIAYLKLTTSWFQLVADDGLSSVTPLLEDSCRQIMSGRIPWWSHHTLCGFPLLPRGCGSIFPPHLLVYIIKSLAGVTTPTFFISIVLHISLCAVSSYFYLRYIGCRIGAAAVGALGYSMAGPAFGFAANWPRDYSIPFAYLPFAFIFIEEALNRRPSIGLIAAGGFIGGNIMLMAHPQMSFKLLLICVLYLGMRSRRRKLKIAIITCALALLIALVIGSAQIFATIELLDHSLRVSSQGVAEYERISFSLRPIFFLGLIFPFAQFDWLDDVFVQFPGGGLFVGPLALLGIIACLRYWHRTKLPVGTFLVLAGLYFLLCLGKYLPGESYLGSLPLLKNFRYPIRWTAEFCAIIALFSGVGLELLLRHRHTRVVKMIFAVFLVCLGLVMVMSSSPVTLFSDYYWLISFCWFGAAVLLWFLLRSSPVLYFIYGAILFTAAGMIVNIPIAKILSPSDLKILWHQPLSIGGDSLERVLFLGTTDPPVAGEGNFSFNMTHYFGGRSVFGYDSLRMEVQRKWKDAISQSGETEFWLFQTAINTFLKTHLMETLRVGWVVVPKVRSSVIPKAQPSLIDACLSHPDLEKIKEGKWMVIFRNNGFKSPAFFIRGLRYDNDLKSGAEMGEVELSKYAWIEPDYRGDMNFINTEASRVSDFSEEHGNISFKTQAEDEGFVVVTTTYYPGWEARINGKETPIYRVNSSFIGFLIPPGKHDIVLEFRPKLLIVLFYIGMIVYLVVLVLVVRLLYRLFRSIKIDPDN
ncbi:MAG TPA: hypothetical protein ENH12_04085 [Proteobacteria bacterium]|nr:hypothetical protein [Pseudomonadota bacterium]